MDNAKTRLVWTAAALLTLAGCGGSDEGSRAALYDSVEALSADSGAVIIGTVVDQTPTTGQPADTVSLVTVRAAFTPAKLGMNLSDHGSAPAVASTVRVRQPGGGSTDSAPLLERGARYLLFLAPSNLETAPGDYYITGGQPGYFTIEGDSYTRVVRDSGDTLPVTITRSDLTTGPA